MYSHPRAGGQPMRPTRPTGLVPIDTHALNASTHHGLRLQGIPLPSAPSTPSQAGPALPSRTVPQQERARAEDRKKTARALASSLSQRRWPYPDGMILGTRYSLMDCLMCDKQGPHYLYSADRDDVFQCDQCFAMFTDDSPKWFE